MGETSWEVRGDWGQIEEGGERERALFEVGEVKSALARSLNATEIFWSDWLQFIQH